MSNQSNDDSEDEDKSTESHKDEDSSTDDQDNKDQKDRGEGPGNLKRRSDWFQKRHGGG